MKATTLAFSLVLFALPLHMQAQNAFMSHSFSSFSASTMPSSSDKSWKDMKEVQPLEPFSRVALGVGISLMGVNLQVATNMTSNLNLRAIGNVFNYTDDNINTNGFNIDAKVNFASAGLALDYYPFSRHGLRLSPGVLLYNKNRITANAVEPSGSSFTLDNVDYYSANSNAVTGSTPITMHGNLGLNATKPAFTLTTGWGNMISRTGGHLSFPFELGAAFTGTPTLAINLTGWACTDKALTQCANLKSASSSIAQEVNTNLDAQIAKWKNDLDVLKVYPILSFGVAYNF